MMHMLKVGIIGIGRLGSIHLRIYNELKEIKKIYLVDTRDETLKQWPDYQSFADYRQLIGKVDLVSIATPTVNHFEIAQFFLKNSIPVLVEKPLTQNLSEAKRLIALSKKNKTLLFVGHVERYNNAYLAIKQLIKNALFIECHRLSPYPHRSLDISVILDLMIHDLDIMLYLIKDRIKQVQAKGVKVISSTEDIANARITFAGGCVANITSSRISSKKERKMRIFMPNCYISMDYAKQEVQIYRKTGNTINKEILPINKEEPLKKEIQDFTTLVSKNKFIIEFAEKAKDALALACKIEKTIKKSQ